MRILCIADVHGNRQQLRAILAAARPADLLLLAGDLTHLGSPDEAREVVALCRAHTPQVLSVTGNCDDELIEKYMAQDGHSLTGRGVRVGEVGLFGVSAAQPFIRNTWEVEESTLAQWAEHGHAMIADAPRKVLVSHPPPRGYVDVSFLKVHGGSRAVREALDRYAIDLIVCGHIHEARGIAHHNQTTIVNCGPAWMGFYAEVEWSDALRAELRQSP